MPPFHPWKNVGFLLLMVFILLYGCDSPADQHSEAEHSQHPSAPVSASDHSADPQPLEHAGHPQPTEAPGTPSITTVALPVNQTVISNQKTGRALQISKMESLIVPGYVTVDPRRSKKVATRVGGRIEKLYTRFNYQWVRKGEKIMDLYSPQLRTVLQEYVYLRQSTSDPQLLENGRKKLALLGITDEQINRLEQGGHSPLTMSIYSPVSGYLLFEEDSPPLKMPQLDAQSSQDDPMSGGMSGNNANKADQPMQNTGRIREGAFLNAGETLFTVNDLKEVWGEFSVPGPYGTLMGRSQPINVKSELAPKEAMTTTIQYVEPVYAPGQPFTRVRTYLDNAKGRLKINSLLSGEISVSPRGQLWVPASSVYDLGRRKIVWVLQGRTAGKQKIFEAREIVTGRIAGDQMEVLKGLLSTEEFALDAGYLTDSESLILTPNE